MNRPRVAIIILCWNGKNDTIECLKSLCDVDYPNFETIVVDNASTDGTAEDVKLSFPDVEVIKNDCNLGFAGGNNVGIVFALEKGFDAVLLLNNDTIVDPKFLSELVDVLYKSPHIGATNPVIYYYDDPSVIWSAGGYVDAKTGIAHQNHINEVDTGILREEIIGYGVGAAILIKREAIEMAGVLDESFFLYYEETEWCYRASDVGFKTVLVPSSKVLHKVSRSFNGDSAIQLYYLSRNRLLFLYRRGKSKVNLLGIAIGEFFRMSASMFARKKPKLGMAVLKGVFDFYRSHLGRATQ